MNGIYIKMNECRCGVVVLALNTSMVAGLVEKKGAGVGVGGELCVSLPINDILVPGRGTDSTPTSVAQN